MLSDTEGPMDHYDCMLYRLSLIITDNINQGYFQPQRRDDDGGEEACPPDPTPPIT